MKSLVRAFLIFLSAFLYAEPDFFIIDGPVTVRKEPTVWSENLGTIQNYEFAEVLETGAECKIGVTKGSWIKVKAQTEGITGWIFSGLGIQLKDSYEISSIEDILKIFPEKWKVTEKARNLFVYDRKKIEEEKLAQKKALLEKKLAAEKKQSEEKPIEEKKSDAGQTEKSEKNEEESGATSSEKSEIAEPDSRIPETVPDYKIETMVRLDYDIKPYQGPHLKLSIFCNPSKSENGRSLESQYNLTESEGSAVFGFGNEYKIHENHKSEEEYFLNLKNGEKLEYFALNWPSQTRWDILSFLKEGSYRGDFDGIMINFYGLWLNRELINLSDISNEYIEENIKKHMDDCQYYAIILEIFRRIVIKW